MREVSDKLDTFFLYKIIYKNIEKCIDFYIILYIIIYRKEVFKMNTIELSNKNYKQITSLCSRIRNTREEWCKNVNSELAKINTYKNQVDATIIIEALEHYLWEEEEELENLFDHMEDKENDENN